MSGRIRHRGFGERYWDHPALRLMDQMFEEVTYSSEAELLAWLVRWLNDTGWEVFQEVSTPHGHCDVVAVRTIEGTEVRWAIEGKMSCNSEVILQAEANMKYFDFVSVCTPPCEVNPIYDGYMKMRGIGRVMVERSSKARDKWSKGSLTHARYRFHPKFWGGTTSPVLTVDVGTNAAVRVDETALPLPGRKKDLVELHALYKNETAGKNSGERVTPYKVSVHKVAEFLRGRGWVDLSDVVAAIGSELHWHDVRAGLRNMAGSWESGTFDTKLEKRKYYIKVKDGK
jgi:hypothetical protein